ncbi:MAG TPA: TIGR01906 family membrane protein [Haloplasmataceae bacterium]
MSRKELIINILTSISLTLLILITAIQLTLNFRPLYYFDIDYLRITEEANMNKREIIKNYDVLIDYLNPLYKGNLQFPTLTMSQQGEKHFIEVKKIFTHLFYIQLVSVIITFVGILYLNKKKDYTFYRLTSRLLLGIPILLFFLIFIDFNKIFSLFHRIMFRNEYWMLYPDKDPIINLLPERFFMHSTLLILIIMFISSLILNRIYRYQIKKYVERKK